MSYKITFHIICPFNSELPHKDQLQFFNQKKKKKGGA